MGRLTAVRDPSLGATGVGVSISVIWIGSLLLRHQTTMILRTLSIALLAWILAMLSLIIYQRRYEQGDPLASGPWQGEITIVDTRTDDVMIAEYAGRSYRYRTDTLYPLGTRLWIAGSVTDETLGLWRDPHEPLTLQAISGEMDRAGWLRMRGLHGTLTPQEVIVQGSVDLPRYLRTKSRLRQRVGDLFGGSESALLMGMLIGDRSGFGDEVYQDFIDSGLVHIVAVSGGNLVMIMVFLGVVLIWVPLRVRVPIMALAVIAYAMIVGMDSSIFRAVIMSLLTMTALLAGRMTSIWRMMGIASLLMLWRNPYFLLQDIGFIFSFAALIGIVLVRPWISQSLRQTRHRVRRQRIPNIIWSDYVLPTAGATIAVMPFLLLFTDSRNILSLLANLLVLPIVPLVMIGGLIVAMITPSIGRTGPVRVIEQVLQYIVSISDRTSTHGRSLYVEQRWFVVILVCVVMWYSVMVYRKGKHMN